MFYSKCTTCGATRRWLTLEETQDEDLVAKNKTTPLTLDEIGKVKIFIDVNCTKCPKKKKKSKKKVAED